MPTKTLTKREIKKAPTPKIKARKDALEAQGWVFEEDNGWWSAKNGEHQTPTFLTISEVFIHCEKIALEAAYATATNGARWTYKEIIPTKFIPSQTGAQAIRRKQLTDANITELVPSVAKQGVLEPILARPLSDGTFELISGERRWRAATIANLPFIPTMVANLRDAEVVDVQYHENSKRTDPDILVEAETFQYYRDSLRMSVAEIAEHCKASVSYIEKSLRLSLLPEEVKAAFEKGELFKNHIREIAKYPEGDHLEIFTYCYHNFGMTSQSLYSFEKAKDQIAAHYLLQLGRAEFSREAQNLGVGPCTSCPERTGAHPNLFDEGYTEKDCCLNRSCYERKLLKHQELVRISREKAKAPKPNNVVSIQTKELVNQPADKMPAESSPERVSIAPPVEETPKVSNQRLFEKERHFDQEVERTVVLRVIQKLSHKYHAANRFVTFVTPEYESLILAQFWQLLSLDDSDCREIVRMLEIKSDELTAGSWEEFDHYHKQIENLSPGDRARLVFLIAHVPPTVRPSPARIHELCRENDISYRILDAEARLALAHDPKQKDLFRYYLHQLELGENPALPRLWAANYKPEAA